jgi:hypothetical protein
LYCLYISNSSQLLFESHFCLLRLLHLSAYTEPAFGGGKWGDRPRPRA